MLAATVKLEGVEKLMQKFGTLSKRIQNRSLGRAMKAGAKPIQTKAKGNAPQDTGKLNRSIAVKKAKSRRGSGLVQYIVYASPKKLAQRKRVNGKYSGYYAAYLEYGTKRMAKRPWLGPAADAAYGETMRNINSVLKAEIEAAT